MTLGTNLFVLLFVCSLTSGCSVLRSFDEIHRHFNAADSNDRPGDLIKPYSRSSATQNFSQAGKFYHPVIT